MNQFANDTQRQIALIKDINFTLAWQIADIATKLAGDRAPELYAPDDEATAMQIAIAAGTACCGGEVSAVPGWAAVESAVAA